MIVLKKLSVHNFKNFQEINLEDFDNLSIFIGANGVGKSNLLDIFSFVHKLLIKGVLFWNDNKEFNIQDYFHQWNTGNNANIFIHLEFHNTESKEDYAYEVLVGRENEGKGDIKILKESFFNHAREIRKDYINGSSEKLLLPELRKDSPEENLVYKYLISMMGYNFYNNFSFFKHFKLSKEEEGSKQLKDHLDDLIILLNEIKKDSIFIYESVINIIKNNVQSIDNINIEEYQGKLVATCTSKFCKTSRDLKYLSEGTLRLFAMVIILNLPKNLRPSILFLEEPEISLHPHLLEILADLIQNYSNDSQIVIVTHSSFLLNKLNVGTLYVLKVNELEEKTVVEKVDKQKLLKWLERYSLGDLWLMNVI